MKSPQAIEFKGIDVALSVLKASLRSADLAALEQVLARIAASSPDFFGHEPTVVDLAELAGAEAPDWTALIALLRRYRIQPIGVCNVAAAQVGAALAAGLAVVDAAEAPPARKAKAPPAAAATLVVDRPLRSGQQVYARGGDVVLLAMVSAGAEVIADGHIHVYAPLRGRALAGASGNTAARIFTTCFEAELVSVGGIYRTFEPGAAKDLAGKPVHVHLRSAAEGSEPRLVVEALATR
jgi:septum site-determining protein MinC